MKAAIYLRVSSLDQDYERQRDELLALAKREGYEVPFIFEEKRSAVKKFEGYREELEKLRKLTKNDIDKVYIWDITRLSRRAIDFINLVNEFTEKGICLHFKDRNIKTLDDSGKQDMFTSLYLYILGQFAQMDAENLKEKFKSGRLRSYREGNSHSSHAPFGYIKQDKKLVVYEPEAKYIRVIFNMLYEGKTLQQVVDYLNATGVKSKTGKLWTNSVLYQNATNTVYKGKARVYEHTTSESGKKRILKSDKFTEYDCPSIISEALFDAVQIKIKTRTKIVKNQTFDSLVRGLLTCPVCGSHYVYSTKSQSEIFYQCGDKRKAENTRVGCTNGGISVKKIDGVIWSVLKNTYKKQQYLEAVLKKKSENTKKIELNKQTILDYQQEIDKVNKAIDKINKGYIIGLYSDTEAINLKKEQQSKIDRLTNTIKELEAENLVLSKEIGIVEVNDNPTFEEKKHIVKELVDVIYLYKFKNTKFYEIFISLKVGYGYNIILNSQTNKYIIVSEEYIEFNLSSTTNSLIPHYQVTQDSDLFPDLLEFRDIKKLWEYLTQKVQPQIIAKQSSSNPLAII